MGKELMAFLACIVIGVVLSQIVSFVLFMLSGISLVGFSAGIMGLVTTFISIYFVGPKLFKVNFFENKKKRP